MRKIDDFFRFLSWWQNFNRPKRNFHNETAYC